MKTVNKYVLSAMVVAFLILNTEAFAQVAIGTAADITPDNSAMLDIQSNAKGVLIPRLTEAQRTGISGPATGLLVFDTTHGSFWYFSTVWTELSIGTPNKIIDADGDTRVEVEKVTDTDLNGDEINFTSRGTERMKIGNDGVTKIGDIAGGNNTKFEADGTIMFEGGAEVWDDLRVSMDRGSDATQIDDLPGESNGAQIWYFRGGNKVDVEAMSFTVQLPHNYKEGTNIFPHIHWTPATTESGNVEWNLDYTWVNYNATTPMIFPASATSTVLETGPFTQRVHMITGLTLDGVGLDGTGKKISSILMCRIWRDGDDTDDTYSFDAGLLSLDFHFQIDTIGSRTTFIK